MAEKVRGLGATGLLIAMGLSGPLHVFSLGRRSASIRHYPMGADNSKQRLDDASVNSHHFKPFGGAINHASSIRQDDNPGMSNVKSMPKVVMTNVERRGDGLLPGNPNPEN